MAGSIKGIIVEIGGDTSGLQKALSKVNSATSSLSKELTGINRLLKLDPKNTELLSQKQEVLNKSIDSTKEKLNELKEIESKAIEKGIDKNEKQQENWRKLQREIISTQNKLRQLLLEQDSWNVSGKKIEEYGEKIIKVSSKIDNLGTKLTKTLTTSIVALGVASGKSAIDFESAFAGVEKTVDGTAEQMANLKQGIRDMSKELPSSATEIASVAEAAGQLGIQTDNVLSFSKVMIDLGNSTNLSADEAATALAKFANITNMSAKDYDKLGSVIVELGNNFATTESDIVSMATRLASTGKLTGLTESQIMSLATAMSSVGIEADVGGTAMSKLLKQIQIATELGGDNLKQFSKVAGMSSNEFKKAFQEDAVKALATFLRGLNNTERNGKSAIAILDDMGIKEVRLSNTILALANSSDLLNNAVDLGNKAWKENTALTNEANKRYATTESKLKTTLNKLKDFATTIGNKLLPSVNRILDSSDKWIKKLEKLDDKTLDNIIRLGLFVAATGPFLKVIGKLGSGIGTTIKAFGQFKQAIAVINTGAKSTSASVNLLAGGLTKLISPLGLVTLGIGYMVTAYTLSTKKAKEQTKEVKELTSSINEEIKARSSVTDAAEKQMQSNLAEVTNIQTLKNELSGLVDENGKIKDGYKSRVDFILNELNKALGTEYSATDNVINNYKELTNTINELIAKKRAQIILEADEEKYREALRNKTSAYETYLEIQEKIAEKQKEIAEFEQMHKYAMDIADVSNYKELKKQLNELTDSLSNSEVEINKYNNAITRYEKNSELAIKGGLENYNKIYSSIVQVEENTTRTQEEEMTKRVQSLQKNVNKSIELYNLEAEKNKNAKDNIYSTNVEESKKNLQLTIDELTKMTSTTGEMSADVINAWKSLAINSRSEYENAISKMPEYMQDRINNITGIVRNDITVKESMRYLGDNAIQQLDRKSDFEETGKNWIRGVSAGINNKLLRQEALSSMYNFGVEGLNAIRRQAWDENSPSKETEKAAIYLLQGVTKGINREKSNTINKMVSFGNELINKFNSVMSLNFDSLQNIPRLQSSISQTISTQLQPKIFTPVINITTQQLDNNEMNRILDNINRKFGIIL